MSVCARFSLGITHSKLKMTVHGNGIPGGNGNSMEIPARVHIAAATLSGNSLRQTLHTHRASVHQAAKLVAALLRVAGVTSGLEESNGSLPLGL